MAADVAPKLARAMERQQRRPWRTALITKNAAQQLNEADVSEMFDRYDMYYRGWMIVRYFELVCHLICHPI